MMSLSAALMDAKFLFLSPGTSSTGAGVDEEDADAALKTFGRLRGLLFKGLADILRVFIFKEVAGVAGLDANDRTTFSPPSSRFNPSSAGGVDDDDEAAPDGPASIVAFSICLAMRLRSCCSSEVVRRSFFKDASCMAVSGWMNKRTMYALLWPRPWGYCLSRQ